MSTKGLERAIVVAGGQTSLAHAIGVSQSHVWNWLNRNRCVPAKRVLDIERATGVPRHEIRPDLYPAAERVA